MISEPETMPIAHPYLLVGPHTDLSAYHALIDELPNSVTELCALVQGLLVHIFWERSYGMTFSEERKQTVQIRPAAAKLAAVFALDDRPLTIARPPERRLVSNCRDFSVMLAALLRAKGIPARARCGFATYFLPRHYEDHWVVEYWEPNETRWVLVDPQIDEVQRSALNLTFDPMDVPRGRFLSGGAAWQRCRAGAADPETFGIFDYHGMGFIRGNLIRDLAALNRVEMLPWDCWGLILPPDNELSDADIALLDTVAHVTVGAAATPSADAVEALYACDNRLRPPDEWTAWYQPV